MEDEFHQKL